MITHNYSFLTHTTRKTHTFNFSDEPFALLLPHKPSFPFFLSQIPHLMGATVANHLLLLPFSSDI